MDNIPYGFCHCGCGQKTRINEDNNRKYGYVKGEPRLFLNRHQYKYRNSAERAAAEKRQARAVYARNRALVDKIRSETVCANCGTQPIEWHNPEHIQKPSHRIALLANGTASVQTILDEIARCTPLCRRCHMLEDGRTKPPRACSQCGRVRRWRLARQMCPMCYQRWRLKIHGPPRP